jgi:molybdopterin converting factor small subunit
MWLKEEVKNPEAPDDYQLTYIRFGLGYNPRNPEILDVLLPNKYKEALKTEQSIDGETRKLLLGELLDRYKGRYRPIAETNQHKKMQAQRLRSLFRGSIIKNIGFAYTNH